MGLKDKLFKVLARAKDELTDEDREQIRALLGGGESEPEPAAETEQADAEAVAEQEQPAQGNEEREIAAKTEPAPETETEPAEQPPNEQPEAPIPPMTKAAPDAAGEDGGEIADAPQEPPPALADDEGGELPVDYQQIIDALTAKNMALEAENARLKAKTEGAFGLTSRPGEFTAVNPLYDNDTADIHFKK